jgi:general secretion pathway protein K
MKSRQKGVAVISAMLFAALTMVIAGQLVWDQRLLIDELENQQNTVQAQWMADGAIQWARPVLAEDAITSEIDNDKELWNTPIPPTPFEGAKISGKIVDLQQYFNINNMGTDTYSKDIFNRLLYKLGLSEKLTSSLIDWLDRDDIENGAEGAESDFYRGLATPYNAANQPLVDLGDLIRVKGFDAVAIKKLRAFTTALPNNTALNINTATAEELSFVLPNISLDDARSIVVNRNIRPFSSVADFVERMPELQKNFKLNAEANLSHINLSVNSQYFLVTCLVEVGHTTLHVEAMIYREGSQSWPQVVWKRIG